ncbi:hypothetical protein GCM10028807_54940 [Spirosoma daeguense]
MVRRGLFTLVQKLSTDGWLGFIEPGITSADIIEFQYRSWIQGGLFFFMIFMGLLYSRYRAPIYRYYFLYVLAASIYTLLKMRAYTPLGNWLSQYSFLPNQFSEAVIWCGMGAYLFFLRELLDLPQHHAQAGRLLRRVAWLCIGYGVTYAGICALVDIASLKTITFWLSRLILVPLHIGLLLWVGFRGQSPLKVYVLIGNGLLLVTSILAWLRAGEVILKGVKLPGSVDDLMRISFGVLLEILVFALALAYRIQLLDQEREASGRAYIAQLEENRQLIGKANVELEKQVSVKTDEVLENQRLLELQRETQLRTSFEKRIAELEMLALRSQMNPHFLFNSLNAIEYLVLKGKPNEASLYLSRFSRLLRLILNHSREETIPLADELKALQLYLDIESTRFDDKFRYVIEVDSLVDPASLIIPPMLLQPFAENAIWHGLMPGYQHDKWLSIRIGPNEQGQIVFAIEDNGIGREQARQTKSITRQKSFGLDITQQRVTLFNQNYPSQIAIQIIDIRADSRTGTLVRITYQPDAKTVVS